MDVVLLIDDHIIQKSKEESASDEDGTILEYSIVLIVVEKHTDFLSFVKL